MRLLNVHTFEVKEFTQAGVPPFAILSHTWGTQEVTLQDLGNGLLKLSPGSRKISNCCKRADKDGFDYVWIDTCCIDKTSSAELSEAINSMFKWYGDAAICYAYLEDVTYLQDHDDLLSAFEKSRWFTRGWTLQELIAPPEVLFFDSDWTEIGSRSYLATLISHRTGIDSRLFVDKHLTVPGNCMVQLSDFTVAQKMSWASARSTTRVEDEAYCLFGLFGINMPLLYGEGRMAFIRLQEEIMKRSSDLSLFAWNRVAQVGEEFPRNEPSGFLAESAACFRDSSEVVPPPPGIGFNVEPYGITNRGIQIRLPVVESEALFTNTSGDMPIKITIYGTWDENGREAKLDEVAILNCVHSSSPDSLITVPLKRQRGIIDGGGPSFHREGRLGSYSRPILAAMRIMVYLQPTLDTDRYQNSLRRNLRDAPLVLIRQKSPGLEMGFRHIALWPPSTVWVTHDSGMLSGRLDNIGTTYIFYENGICLVVAFDKGRVESRVIPNVPISSDGWEPAHWSSREGKTGGNLVVRHQDDDAEERLRFAARTTKHLFGYFIELDIEVSGVYGFKILDARIHANRSSKFCKALRPQKDI